MHIFMFSNKHATYDLSCILTENRFCYLLQREIYFVLYITCVRLQRVKTFCKIPELMIHINVYLHLLGRLHYQTTIIHKCDRHVCFYRNIYRHFILFYSNTPHYWLSRISFLPSLRTLVLSLWPAHLG